MDEELREIIEKIQRAPGFVLMVGYISGKKDPKGFPMIDFRYKREQFSWEDTSKAIAEFKRFLNEEINGTQDAV